MSKSKCLSLGCVLYNSCPVTLTIRLKLFNNLPVTCFLFGLFSLFLLLYALCSIFHILYHNYFVKTDILDAYNHGSERQLNAFTENQGKEGDATPCTEIHLNGHTLEHSGQTRNGNLTKEDIAKALHATAMTVCDIEGLLGNQ